MPAWSAGKVGPLPGWDITFLAAYEPFDALRHVPRTYSIGQVDPLDAPHDEVRSGRCRGHDEGHGLESAASGAVGQRGYSYRMSRRAMLRATSPGKTKRLEMPNGPKTS